VAIATLRIIPVIIAVTMALLTGGSNRADNRGISKKQTHRRHQATIITTTLHANSTISKKVTRGKHIKRHKNETFKWTCAIALN
jgi:dTDP-4-dehydrorhamnose 3,5-epimerase-like enzyme